MKFTLMIFPVYGQSFEFSSDIVGSDTALVDMNRTRPFKNLRHFSPKVLSKKSGGKLKENYARVTRTTVTKWLGCDDHQTHALLNTA